jgi:hypothetical protein
VITRGLVTAVIAGIVLIVGVPAGHGAHRVHGDAPNAIATATATATATAIADRAHRNSPLVRSGVPHL